MANDLTLTFLQAGLQTTLQDKGRAGLQYLGVPVGGALDITSAAMANHLVGNEKNVPVLEITMTGPEILFDSDALIALTGAPFELYCDDKLVENNTAIYLKSGSILKFGKLKSGCRAYLAVAGEWNAKKWKDSVSPLLQVPEATPDSIIKKGTKLKINSAFLNKTGSWDKNKHTPILSNRVRLRVKPGPEFDSISRIAIAKFFGQGHEISKDANRMGYRLTTNLTNPEDRSEMISSGIIPGTIQITGSGQPIILLKDAQTTGGYPRIANIINEDLDQLAQLKPGDEVWFSIA
ncbi:biotin-dependent carboxyltransferase family protein [Marivirga salinae]|uniref:Biotin-dependent carboxyltransferase family protein n=1 Tax=Marivirga salinarum TaxID=3059078 RepID=A0AA51N9B0_9BACT|nr:biotin-dependent carboxyltransferase family protein [Marivirga sp. BDSF4-3]WMN11089.1 biotin-dependent carboxyltransferase family protein [Marivirga sp. BDSF4-3]